MAKKFLGFVLAAAFAASPFLASAQSTALNGTEQFNVSVNGLNYRTTTGAVATLANHSGLFVTQRAPTLTDDVNAGYSVGDFWVTPADTREWVNVQNTAGQAIWQPYVNGNTYPVDAIGGTTPVFCVGTKRLKASYTGPVVNVENPVSLATTDIYATANGDIDRNALMAAQGTATYLLIDTAYDQCGTPNPFTGSISGTTLTTSSGTPVIGQVVYSSGATAILPGTTIVSGSGTSWVVSQSQTVSSEAMTGSNAAYQATVANMPIMTPPATLGNSVSIVFNGVIQGTTTSKWLNIPVSMTTTTNVGMSQVVLASARDTAQNDPIMELLNVSGSNNNNLGFNATNSAFVGTFGGITINLSTLAPLTPFSAGAVYPPIGGGATRIWLDNQTTTNNNQSAPSYIGGFIGKTSSGGLGAYTELSEVLIYNRVLSVGDQAAANAVNYRYFAIAPQIRDQYVIDGDSKTEGYGTVNSVGMELNQTYARQMVNLLNRPYRIYNIGAFGQYCVGPGAFNGRLFFLQSNLSEIFIANPKTVQMFSEWCGTNEIAAGLSAQQTESDNASVVNYVKSSFPGTYFVNMDMEPRTGFTSTGTPTYESQRLLFNTWMTSGLSGADAVVDLAGDPTIGSNANVGNTTYYFDGIHGTQLTASFEAQYLAAQINALK